MSTFIKPFILGLGLVAGIALTAQAQTAVTPGPSIANLPPVDQGPRVYSHGYQGSGTAVTVAPSSNMPGPDAGRGWYPHEQQTQAVEPSPPWQGPKPN